MSARIVDGLRRIAQTETLLVALDFDGTVAHFADDPMVVRAIPEAAAAVDALARLEGTYVAYVSGRSLRDLTIISERPPVAPIILIGSHGAEQLLPAVLGESFVDDVAPEVREQAATVLALLQDAVVDLDGVMIEEKAYGFALHTRRADAATTERAQHAVLGIMRGITPAWRQRSGKDVLEFAWRHDGKDQAVSRLRALTGATAVLFAGDDLTDEDALRTLGEDDLGVHVGGGETAATLTVSDPEELAALLNVVAAIRAARNEE